MSSQQLSSKQKRARLMADRATDRSIQNSTLVQQQTVVEEESHNFRLPDDPNSQGKSAKTIFTVFHVREAQHEVNKRIVSARAPIFYNDMNRCASGQLYRRVIPIPLRPMWNNRMPREVVQKNETDRFKKYLEIIYNTFPPSRLNHFEHNLDVWRQLWRVCEISDVLLLTVDARHPLFHFPPSLYDFIVKKMNKPMVVVFNKIDLVPAQVLLDWTNYFEKKYPGVTVFLFSSYPQPDSVTLENINLFERRKHVLGLDSKANARKVKPFGVTQLLKVLRSLSKDSRIKRGLDVNDNTDYSIDTTTEQTEEVVDIENKENNKNVTDDDGEDDDEDDEDIISKKPIIEENSFKSTISKVEAANSALASTAFDEDDQKNSVDLADIDSTALFTIGLVGHPNAGKSSLINSIMDRRVVSVSNTPGHTKHLQTIAKVTNNPDLQLCDCPGLVFPAADMPRPLQVLMGIFPITSLREPYTCVQFLAERLPLVDIYGLTPFTGPTSDCALYGPLNPGGVSAEKKDDDDDDDDDDEDNKNQGKGAIKVVPTSGDYSTGKLATVSCASNYPFLLPDTISSSISVNEVKQKVKGKTNKINKASIAQKGRKGKKNSTKDDWTSVDEQDELFAEVDAMLATVNVRGDGTVEESNRRFVWSAWRICEALALKKGWMDQDSPNVFQAGMMIIDDCHNGRLSLFFEPPVDDETIKKNTL